jgi:SAM-dependent methyltransferase
LTDFETKIGTTFLDYEQNPVYNSYHKYSHEKAVSRLLPESNGGIAADLGCAGGTYYGIIKAKNYKTVYGVDLSAKRLEKAKEKGYITFNTLAQNLPFKNESVDAILSIDVLVHVLKRKDREDIFKEVSRVLKKGGHFVFSIPSKKAYVHGDYGVDKKTIYSNDDGIINDYCSLIDFTEIEDFINKLGFKLLETISTQFDLKLFKLFKRVTKERFHYNNTLPFLDRLFGKTFLREYGKAVFFKIQKL